MRVSVRGGDPVVGGEEGAGRRRGVWVRVRTAKAGSVLRRAPALGPAPPLLRALVSPCARSAGGVRGRVTCRNLQLGVALRWAGSEGLARSGGQGPRGRGRQGAVRPANEGVASRGQCGRQTGVASSGGAAGRRGRGRKTWAGPEDVGGAAGWGRRRRTLQSRQVRALELLVLGRSHAEPKGTRRQALGAG